MALLKPITKDNGITLNYHRILFIQSTINRQTSIAVLSYLNEESREKENTANEPYKEAITYETPCVENMTTDQAYDYLKSLPEFEGASYV